MNISNHTHTKVRFPWMSKPIRAQSIPFYSHRETEPGCQFSNLYECSVRIDTTQLIPGSKESFLVTPDGIVSFSSSENAFQCSKALLPLHDHFVRSLSPLLSAHAGQGRLKMRGKDKQIYKELGGTPIAVGTGKKKKFLISADGRYPRRNKWEELKLGVMAVCLEAKFTQNAGLWGGLESDKDMTYFIEHTHNDSQWGDRLDGFGKNYLGKLLSILLYGNSN